MLFRSGQQLAFKDFELAVLLFDSLFHRNLDIEDHILQIVVFDKTEQAVPDHRLVTGVGVQNIPAGVFSIRYHRRHNLRPNTRY